MSSNNVFNKQILAEKLSKFNSSANSIQLLSKWCVSHRKKAKLIVETWDKQFKSSQKEQLVSFLYLANDILQNSRRKGSEFVHEFWKVLPAALKHVHDNGGDNEKKLVFRLTDIWEERKVFGSRGQNLKNEIMGKELPPPPSLSVDTVQSSNLIKILKRDALAVRIKLPVGDMPEILLTAFEALQEEHVKEEAALNNCKTAVQYVKSVEDNIEKTMAQGGQVVAVLGDELQNQENILLQCVLDFETAEATRAALASKLREALQNQESELEHVRTQLQVAKSLVEQAREMKKNLTKPHVPLHQAATTDKSTQSMRAMESSFSSFQQINTQPILSEPATSFAQSKVSEEEKTKAAAAAVAARLTASTSSAQMLSSVLSSLVAEEAAALHGGSKSAGFSSDSLGFPSLKRQKQEQPSMTNAQSVPTTGMPKKFQPNQSQAMFAPSLPTLVSPTNPLPNQFGPPIGMMPYGYGAYPNPPPLLPPPPFPPQSSISSARPATIPPHQPQQQLPSNGSYYGPPSFNFYGQTHQPNSSPVARQ